MEEQREQQKDTFYYTHHTLKHAKQIQKHSCFLMGEIRSGKSTTFNLINDPMSLIGQGNQKESIYVHKKRDDVVSKGAVVNDGYASVTLIPNMVNIKSGNGEISLVDLPGFNDNRKISQSILIKFILNCFFAYSQNTRFILVISEKGFTSQDGNEFVRLFQEVGNLFSIQNLSAVQKQNFCSSMTLVVTSVKLEQDYETQKNCYLELLQKNLGKLRRLSEKNNQVQAVFPNIQAIIQDIIANRRLELFQKAKVGISPTPFFNARFESPKWSEVNLRELKDSINFNYSKQFQTLTDKEKQQLQKIIFRRIYIFDELRQILAHVIENFIMNVWSQYIEVNTEFQMLEQLLETLRIHEDIPTFDDQIQSLQNGTTALKRLKCVFELNQLAIDLSNTDYSEKQQNYFSYLKTKFQSSMKIITKNFCFINKHQFILQTLTIILSDALIQLNYLSQMSIHFVSICQNRVKEAIAIMNLVNYSQKQIIKKAFSDFVKIKKFESTMKTLNEKDLLELINFFNNAHQQGLVEQNSYLQISFKLHKEQVKKSKEMNQKFYHTLKASVFKILLHYCKMVERQLKISEIQDQLNCKYGNKMSCIFYGQCFSTAASTCQWKSEIAQLHIQKQIVFKSFEQLKLIANIFQQSGFFNIVNSMYLHFIEQSPIIKLKKVEKVEMMKIMASNYINFKMGKKAEEIFDKMKNMYNLNIPAENKLNLSMISQITTMRCKISQSSQNDSDNLMNNQKELIERYLKLYTNLWNYYRPDQEYFVDKDIMEQIKAKYVVKQSLINTQSEFNVELPKNISNHQIIRYSSYLINKIGSRKMTIIIGGSNSAKTTAFYWLRRKPMVITQLSKDFALDLSEESQQINRINHNRLNPTEVPNICNLNEQELLIDTPSLLFPDPYKKVFYRYIFSEQLNKSKECRFLLVIRQEDLLHNGGVMMVKWIMLYHSLNNQQEKEKIDGLALLITFATKKTPEIKKLINKLKEEFEDKRSQIELMNRFGIESSDILVCCRYIQNLLKRYEVFHRANKDTIPVSHLLTSENLPESWKYFKMHPPSKEGEFVKSCLQMKQSSLKQLSTKMLNQLTVMNQALYGFIHNLLLMNNKIQIFTKYETFLLQRPENKGLVEYYNQLCKNKQKNEIEIDSIDLCRTFMAPKHSVVDFYLVNQQLLHQYTQPFNVRSKALLKNIDLLMKNYSRFKCSNEQQYRSLCLMWIWYKCELEERLTFLNYVYAVMHMGQKYDKLIQSYQILNQALINLNCYEREVTFSEAFYEFELKSFQAEIIDPPRQSLTKLCKFIIQDYQNLSNQELHQIQIIINYLEAQSERYQYFKVLAQTYILKVKLINKKIISSPSSTEDLVQYFKIALRKLAVALSTFEQVQCLEICSIINHYETRTNVFSNLSKWLSPQIIADTIYQYLKSNDTPYDHFCTVANLYLQLESDIVKKEEIKQIRKQKKNAISSTYANKKDDQVIQNSLKMISTIKIKLQ